MSERFAALVKAATEAESVSFGSGHGRALARLVLDFADEHVMMASARRDTVTVEFLVPFASPLRDIDSVTGKPSWMIVPTAVVTVLQRAIPLLVRLGDYVGNSDNEGRGEVLGDAHEALRAIGADVPNAYPPAADLAGETGTAGAAGVAGPCLAELIAAVEAFPKNPRLGDVETLARVLAWYEATGDHNHGAGSIKGAPCPGGDCYVDKARKLLAAVGGES